jgi:hypothetical protein
VLANTFIIDNPLRSNTPFMTEPKVRCPKCGSDAIYRYGRTHNGKRRFICILCRRQFSVGARKCEVQDRPDCPQCRRPMHIYKREKGCIRFRCSAYPQCRTYKKIVVTRKLSLSRNKTIFSQGSIHHLMLPWFIQAFRRYVMKKVSWVILFFRKSAYRVAFSA